MAGAFDIIAREKAIGSHAANTLRKDFKAALGETANIKGESKKATVRARYKDMRLDRITFSAPNYIFMQHYGFEGTKKNHVMMRLKATDVFNIALQKSNVLDTLATQIAENRMGEVILKINLNGQ